MIVNDHLDDRHFADPPSQLSETAFVERFTDIYENSPWVARVAWRYGLNHEHDTIAGLAQALAYALSQASREQQLALICAHPDLAGRAAQGGDLTEASSEEQQSAGLDQCTREQYQRFQILNAAYKSKFGFPFVLAVRGLDRHAILMVFEKRLHNHLSEEFDCALSEINKIARLRLQAMSQQQSIM